MRTSPKRIVVIGNSCAGKSTFAARLAQAMNLRHIELDALFWEANWKEADRAVFRSRVAETIQSDAWIVDGNYREKLKDIVWSNANLMVWLDPPLTTILRRYVIRTASRLIKGEMLWGTCRETLKGHLFDKNSLLIWILTTHRKKQNEYTKLMQNPPQGVVVQRLRSEKQVEEFFKNLAAQ